jgi:hypothetical protein
MSDQTPWDIRPFTLMLMSDCQSGATEATVYHAADVDAARQQVDAQHAEELQAERNLRLSCLDMAEQEVERLKAQHVEALAAKDRELANVRNAKMLVTWGGADAVVATLVAERDAAQQEIQTLQEGLTWALDALEERMRNSPTPPLPSEAPMTETPTDVTAILARPMRVALAAYYDAKRALAQTKADDAALMGRTVRMLTDAEVIDEYERMLGRR